MRRFYFTVWLHLSNFTKPQHKHTLSNCFENIWKAPSSVTLPFRAVKYLLDKIIWSKTKWNHIKIHTNSYKQQVSFSGKSLLGNKFAGLSEHIEGWTIFSPTAQSCCRSASTTLKNTTVTVSRLWRLCKFIPKCEKGLFTLNTGPGYESTVISLS